MNLHALTRLSFWFALACVLGAAVPYARADELDDSDESESQNEKPNEPQKPAARERQSEHEAQGEPAGEDESAPSEAKETPATEASEPHAPRVQVSPFLGFGLGTRAFQRPTPLGGQRLDTVVFPAADVGLQVIAWPKAQFSLGVLFRYQTSIGLQLDERPPFALNNETGTRSERAELSVAPTFRFGDDERSPAVAFPIGLSIRTLWPNVHNSLTPGYSLLGPQVRAELRLPITPAFSLRLGPELQWIMAIDDSLQRDGAASNGVSIGAEAGLQFMLVDVLALDLSYREAHASASSLNGGEVFKDSERFVTLRLMGVL